jgi:hypothetical protein
MGFTLSTKWYEFFKWLVQIVLPAVSTAYLSLDAIWGLPSEDKVVATSAVVATLLGVTMKISSKNYEGDAELVLTDKADGGIMSTLEFGDRDPADIIFNKDSVVLKVRDETTPPYEG